MKMERDTLINVSFTDNSSLMPLPPSDFTPFSHDQLVLNSEPEFASFNFPLNHEESTHLFDFFSKPSPLHTLQPSLSLSLDHSAHTHTQTQHHRPLTESSSSSTGKRRRGTDVLSMVQPNKQGVSLSPPVRRREKMSDKTQRLQKLMPFDNKMDIATMLEEAYKYVQFLQAQIRALSSMPLQSSFIFQNDCEGIPFGCLGMLNRQQLLQVSVNSPAVQTMLCSQGFCVFSLEQLLLMNKLSQAKLASQWTC